MRLRDHEGVKGKRDSYPFDPRLLKVDPAYNVRDLTSPDARAKLAELKEQIRGAGVRTPLEVRIAGEDVVIVSGHRRHRAVLELIAEGEPIETVLVIQEPLGTSDAERTLNLALHNSGEPLRPLEIAHIVKRLSDFGWDHGQIAKRMGWKSRSSVTQHLDMLGMPEDLQAAVKRNSISATQARKSVAERGAAATLKIIEDNEKQGKRTRPRDVPRKPKATPPAAAKAPQPEKQPEQSPAEPPAQPPELHDGSGDFTSATFEAPAPEPHAVQHFTPLADETPPAVRPTPMVAPETDSANQIAGKRTIDGMQIGFGAKHLPNIDQWEVVVVDAMGEQTKDIDGDPWTMIALMVEAAVAASRERMKELAQ